MFDWGDRLKDIQEDIKKILVDQAAMKEDLRHHIKRTDAIESTILPVVKHVANIEGVIWFMKLVALVATTVGAVYAAKSLF